MATSFLSIRGIFPGPGDFLAKNPPPLWKPSHSGLFPHSIVYVPRPSAALAFFPPRSGHGGPPGGPRRKFAPKAFFIPFSAPFSSLVRTPFFRPLQALFPNPAPTPNPLKKGRLSLIVLIADRTFVPIAYPSLPHQDPLSPTRLFSFLPVVFGTLRPTGRIHRFSRVSSVFLPKGWPYMPAGTCIVHRYVTRFGPVLPGSFRFVSACLVGTRTDTPDSPVTVFFSSASLRPTPTFKIRNSFKTGLHGYALHGAIEEKHGFKKAM